MIVVDLKSKTPIYAQIKEQIIYLIGCGVLKPNDQLPSIRALAKELSLNVNTVKRAFNELESDGVTYSLPGRGVFVSETAVQNKKVISDALADVEQVLRSAKAKGVSAAQILALMEALFGEGES